MPDATIDVLLNEPIATINPLIYGHFMEHLGACIYDGAWVGPNSPIPNTGGIRNDVVDALKSAGASVIRWPGGCFADDYHWEDGVGDPGSRPRTINIHWGDVIETNQFGTHEFLALCRAVGAAPYICGNVGSGSPREMRDWVEYCNFPGDSTRARQRSANGSPQPFGVRYWGVGNENWGCGGNFTPEDYCSEYRRFVTYLRNWGSDPLYLIACGPCGDDPDWTRRFFTKLQKDYWPCHNVQGFAAHYYCGTAGTATEYTTEEWYRMLWQAIQMEPLVRRQRAAMDAFDPERKIGLIVDEWGAWHPPAPGRNPAFLWQQNTIRDALVAALTLDIFNRHADKVVMANIAQTINVLQALALTEGDKLVVTPTCHVYELYKPHQGADAVRMVFDSPCVSIADQKGGGSLPVVSGSASVSDRRLTVTLTNASVGAHTDVEIRLSGALAAGAVETAAVAAPDGDIRSHNTFDRPTAVRIAPGAHAALYNADVRTTLPPASVTRLTVALA